MIVDDNEFPFTDLMVNHTKLIETRPTRAFKSHELIDRMGIIRKLNGQYHLVATCVLGRPRKYTKDAEFDADYNFHKVNRGSKFYIKDGGIKWGYPLLDLRPTERTQVYPKGCSSVRYIDIEL